MAGLGDLIKKQKESTNGAESVHESPKPADGPAGNAIVTSDSVQPERLEAAATPTPTPAATKFRFGGGAKQAAESARETIPATDVARTIVESKPANSNGLAKLKLNSMAESKQAGGMSDALAAIAASESAGSAPVNTGGDDVEYIPQFPDLVDVKIPERELPADITMEAKGFVEQLDQIYSIAYDPELFGQFVRTIMQELQEHPDYIKLMCPEDSYVLVRGLREAMGMAAVKKESKKKSTTTTTRKAPKSSEMDSLLDNFTGGDAWD